MEMATNAEAVLGEKVQTALGEVRVLGRRTVNNMSQESSGPHPEDPE